MSEITREDLFAYLDDALSDAETARVERGLRESEELRESLRLVGEERDRGEHTVGAVWRRARLTCPSRDDLGAFLLGVLDPTYAEYVTFHLETVGCAYCRANVDDLREMASGAKPAPRGERLYRSTKQRLGREPRSGD